MIMLAAHNNKHHIQKKIGVHKGLSPCTPILYLKAKATLIKTIEQFIISFLLCQFG